MNKRIKKKHNRRVMIGSVVHSTKQWNTNTPYWKRIKASGRKLKMYYDIRCIYSPNRNNRTYDHVLVQAALKDVSSYE